MIKKKKIQRSVNLLDTYDKGNSLVIRTKRRVSFVDTKDKRNSMEDSHDRWNSLVEENDKPFCLLETNVSKNILARNDKGIDSSTTNSKAQCLADTKHTRNTSINYWQMIR